MLFKNPRLPNVVSLGLFASLVVSVAACSGVKGADNSQARINQTVEQAKLDSAAAIKPSGSNLDGDKTLDVAAGGGQPGTLSFSGAATTLKGEKLAIDSHFAASSAAGIGWRGTRAPLSSSTVLLKAETTPSEAAAIAKQKLDTHFINVGCAKTALKGLTDGLEEIPMASPSADAEHLEAHSVFVCDASLLGSGMIEISASLAVINSMSLQMSGVASQRGLSLAADELEIEGQSVVFSIGVDGTRTINDGPGISFSANRVSGDGTVTVTASGSNFKKN